MQFWPVWLKFRSPKIVFATSSKTLFQAIILCVFMKTKKSKKLTLGLILACFSPNLVSKNFFCRFYLY